MLLLCRNLGALARSLAALDAALQAPVSAGSLPAIVQLHTAASVLTAGAILTSLLGLEAAVGAQLGAAARILLGSGRCLLDALRRSPALRRRLDSQEQGNSSRHIVSLVQALCQMHALLSSEPLARVRAQAFAPDRAVPWLVALVDCLLTLAHSPAGGLLPHQSACFVLQ